MSTFISICLNGATDLDQSPDVHIPAAHISDRRLSIHLSVAGVSVWSHDAAKFRALATTLTRAADALDAANAEMATVAS